MNANGSLDQKAITIGSNDGINVQVLSGVTVGTEVVTSLANMNPQANAEKKDSGDSSSPFMPKRPRRDNSKAK